MNISKTGLTMRVIGGLVALLLAQSLHLGIGAPTSTGLSGFGARSLKKTIFPVNNNITSKTPTMPLSTPQTIANAIFSPELQLDTDRPKLWVKRSRDPDILWFQMRDSDENAIKTLRISVVDPSGEWEVQEGGQQHSSSSTGGEEEWIAIEGIYGFYRLPSGIMWILVTKTKPVYTAPSLMMGDEKAMMTHSTTPWWQIRRVSNFELVHLSSPDRMLSTAHLKEEVRQLRLLRQSLKEHEFYFVPASESSIVKDMTCNLQDSFETHFDVNPDDSTTTSWWDSSEHRPDPRFFWNQPAVEPILQRYESLSSSSESPTSVKSLLSNLLEHIVPLTSAFVGVQSNVTDSKTGLSYDQLLISRRSRFRAGTRFTRRGADGFGAVANFAETEQVCLMTTLNGTAVQHVMSHLQTRGSVPLRWSSPADVKTYRPRVRIGTDPLAQARALRLHLLEQFSYYVSAEDEGRRRLITRDSNSSSSSSSGVAKLIFVNLIDKHKDQGRLGRAFDAVLRAVMDVYAIEKEAKKEPPPPRLYDLHSSPISEEKDDNKNREKEMLGDPKAVEHVWFDFHAEVKDGRWDRLTGLLKDLQPALIDHGYFLANAPDSNHPYWNIRQTQNAIIRTNCMDCLDRTNVVQSLFGRYVLFHQLLDVARDTESSSDNNNAKATWDSHSSTYNKNPTAIPWAAGETSHRLLWADNADAISRLYAGTAALKGDFTRTGKRTKRGALDDGMNSLQRYYLNNFLDADRQEGIDLLVGYTSFTNVDDDIDIDIDIIVEPNNDEGSTITLSDDMAYISIKKAARENFFGKMIGRLEDQEKAKLQEELIGVVSGGETVLATSSSSQTTEAIDLRWLPGDLHSHMISNADQLLGESTKPSSNNDDDDDIMAFEFSSAKALASMDRRSASDAPWWADLADDDDSLGSGMEEDFDGNGGLTSSSIEEESDSEDEEVDDVGLIALPEYQRLPPLERSQILGILVVGLRAPMGMATAVVTLLALIFLPAVVQHDFLNRR